LASVLLDFRDSTGASLVLIEHDMPLITSVSDRLVALDLGRKLIEGDPEVVLADPAVTASYLGTDRATIERSGRASGVRGRSRSSRTRAPRPL
jgi:branched-chain amino acid transport system ATP-binding protein